MKSPEKGIVASLELDGSWSKFLILSLDNEKILMRIIGDELAAYADKSILEPGKPGSDPAFSENQLSKGETASYSFLQRLARASSKLLTGRP